MRTHAPSKGHGIHTTLRKFDICVCTRLKSRVSELGSDASMSDATCLTSVSGPDGKCTCTSGGFPKLAEIIVGVSIQGHE